MPNRNFQSQGQHKSVSIDRIPDSCPLCHSAVAPTETASSHIEGSLAEILFVCPNGKCARYFIARYRINQSAGGGLYGQFQTSVPNVYQASGHSKIISELSPSFVRIYGQAEAAEAQGLDEISGVGYRRSLEFLIKDYLLSIHTDATTQEGIRAQMLGRCMNNTSRMTTSNLWQSEQHGWATTKLTMSESGKAKTSTILRNLSV